MNAMKTMSMVERFDLNGHCDSGYTLSAIFCSLFSKIRAKTFSTMLRSEIPR